MGRAVRVKPMKASLRNDISLKISKRKGSNLHGHPGEEISRERDLPKQRP